MGSSTETEAKFDADASWQLPDLGDLVAHEIEPTTLVAVYWDTEDRRLDACGVTLRHRVADDGHAVWTAKLPIGRSEDGVLEREEVDVDGPADTPPTELRSLLLAITCGAPLAPIAELRTERRRHHAGWDRWADAVEITDDLVSSTVGGRTGPTFRQIEVELIDERAHDVLEEAIAALRTAGLRSSRQDSKLRRVLGDPPQRSDRDGDDDAVTVDGLVSTRLHAALSTLVRNDPRIRLGDDEAAVHTYRKAVRRLRSDLKHLRSVLDRRRSDRLRDELTWLGGLLGAVRDLHVLRNQLGGLADEAGIDAGELAPVLDVLDAQLTIERSNLLSAMEGDRYLELIREMRELEHHVPLSTDVAGSDPAAEAVTSAGHRAWRKLRTARRHAEDRPSAEQLHTVRKKVKQARAAAQLAKETDVGSKRQRSAKRFARTAGELKDQLGDLHDADVLVEWLDHVADRLEPTSAYRAGRLRERAVQRRTGLDDAWRAMWQALDKKKLRRWTS